MSDFCPVCGKDLWNGSVCSDCAKKFEACFVNGVMTPGGGRMTPPGLEGFTKEDISLDEFVRFWSYKARYDDLEKWSKEHEEENTIYTRDQMVKDMSVIIKYVQKRREERLHPKPQIKFTPMSNEELFDLLRNSS